MKILGVFDVNIDQDEVDKLCTFGFRGRNCSDIEGSGAGLYIVKKALKLNNLKFKITTDVEKLIEFQNKTYSKNIFKITGSI